MRARANYMRPAAILLFAAALMPNTFGQTLPAWPDAQSIDLYIGQRRESTDRPFAGQRFVALRMARVHAQRDEKSRVVHDILPSLLVYAEPDADGVWARVMGTGQRPYPDLYHGRSEKVVDVREDGRIALPAELVDRDEYRAFDGFVRIRDLALIEGGSPLPVVGKPVPQLWGPLGIRDPRMFVDATPSGRFAAVVQVEGPAAEGAVTVRCSGSLVGRRDLVLTAGHCFRSGTVTVKVQESDATSSSIVGEVIASNFVWPHSHSYATASEDWALVKLRRTVSARVAPLQIASPATWRGRGHVEMIATGFAQDLAAVRIALGTTSAPNASICTVLTRLIKRGAGGGIEVVGDASDCVVGEGDSGGPLLLWNADLSRYEIVAISSWSDAGKNLSATDDARAAFDRNNAALREALGVQADWAGFDAVRRRVGFFQDFYMKHVRFLLSGSVIERLHVEGVLSDAAAADLWRYAGGMQLPHFEPISDKEIETVRKAMANADELLASSTSNAVMQTIGELFPPLSVRSANFAPLGPLLGVVPEADAWQAELETAMKSAEDGSQKSALLSGEERAKNYRLVIVDDDAFLVRRRDDVIVDVVRNLLFYGSGPGGIVSGSRLYPHWREKAPEIPPVRKPESDDIPPTGVLRSDRFGAPTPQSIVGAHVVDTGMIWRAMLDARGRDVAGPIVIAAIEAAVQLPGAHVLAYASRGGSFDDAVSARLKSDMVQIAPDPQRAIVVYCHHENCWLSHNLVLRLIRLGYLNVWWFRGGLNAWAESGLPFERSPK
ncbi:MAG: trypsin-like serine protease [Halothiobacillaceae bacterium]|nr:trypsin-like serine protease [Halothiobacillaceae bacterium]